MDITAPQLAGQVVPFLAYYDGTWAIEAAHGLPSGLLLAIGSRETGLDFTVYGDGTREAPGGAYGVFQLQCPPHTRPDPFPIAVQAETAAAMLAANISQGVVAAAIIYNVGHLVPDVDTANADYGSDVADRLAAIQILYPNGNAAGSTVTATAATTPGTTFSVAAKYNPKLGVIPGVDPGYRASAALNPKDWLFFHNAKGPSIIDLCTTDSVMDLTVGQVPQIQLTIVDPRYEIFNSVYALINQHEGLVGQLVRWRAEVFVLAEVQTSNVSNVPATIFTLRSAVFAWMQAQRPDPSAAVAGNAPGSATQWLYQVIAEYNSSLPADFPRTTFLGQATGVRGSNLPNATRPPTSWISYFDYATQLASEEGCWLFETAGGVFFGEPPWIFSHTATVKVGWPGLDNNRPYVRSTMDVEAIFPPPAILRSEVLFTGDTMVLNLARNVGEQMRCGQAIKMNGIGLAVDTLAWLVQGVSFAFDGGATPVQVTCNQAKYLRPTEPGGQTPASPTSDPTGTQGPSPSPAVAATTSTTAFVTVARTQTGDAYSQEAQVAGVQFDCSGLVQYSSQQVGSPLGNYRDTASQYAYLQTVPGAIIPVAQAYATYGALLYGASGEDEAPGVPGHVAISLGDNEHIFQESQPGVPCGVASVPWPNSFFYIGALVPGLDYTATTAQPGVPGRPNAS